MTDLPFQGILTKLNVEPKSMRGGEAGMQGGEMLDNTSCEKVLKSTFNLTSSVS